MVSTRYFFDGVVNNLYALQRMSIRKKCPQTRVIPPPMMYQETERGRSAKKTVARVPFNCDFKMVDAIGEKARAKRKLPAAGIQRKASINGRWKRSDTRAVT